MNIYISLNFESYLPNSLVPTDLFDYGEQIGHELLIMPLFAENIYFPVMWP